MDKPIVKAKLVKEARKKLFAVTECESDAEAGKLISEYYDWLDEKTAEIHGLTVEELDNLEYDEKERLQNIISEKVKSNIDFLKSSLPLRN